MILTIIESPFTGQLLRNLQYARAALRDSLMRKEAPIASHLLYTQPGVLNDHIPSERELGIKAGHEWMREAQRCAVYADFRISPGMQLGIERARHFNVPVEWRFIIISRTDP